MNGQPIIIEDGDSVTLYSLSDGDILEIVVGEGFADEVESAVNGKTVKDVVRVAGEAFEIQYICKGYSKIQRKSCEQSDGLSKATFASPSKINATEPNVVPTELVAVAKGKGLDMLAVICKAMIDGNKLPIHKRVLIKYGVNKTDIRNLTIFRKLCVHEASRCFLASRGPSTAVINDFADALREYVMFLAGDEIKVDQGYVSNILRVLEKIKTKNEHTIAHGIENYVVHDIIRAIKQAEVKLKWPNNIPPSTIIVAKIKADITKETAYVTVVTNEKDQDSNEGIYWMGRALASALMLAVKIGGTNHFWHKDKKYEVLEFKKYKDAEKYLQIITRFCNPNAPQTVYVFEQKHIGHFQSEKFEMVTAMVPCADMSFPVPITVYYEKETHIYFINEALYTISMQKYGLPYIKLLPAPKLAGSTGFASLRAHSELNLLGYTVNATDGLDINARRQLLSRIMDAGILKKAEIINHLEWLINSRSTMINHGNAIAEWKADLWFVSRYQSEKQREIWVKSFKRMYSSQG